MLAGWFCRPSQAAKQRVTVALERVDMLHLADRFPGGVVGWAAAASFFWPVPWPRMPTLLLLDEPFTGIDRKNRRADAHHF